MDVATIDASIVAAHHMLSKICCVYKIFLLPFSMSRLYLLVKLTVHELERLDFCHHCCYISSTSVEKAFGHQSLHYTVVIVLMNVYAGFCQDAVPKCNRK